MTNTQNHLIHYLFIIVVCFFAFFVNNQIIPADLMESRNLATAQEMIHTDNYLMPTMNGEPRLEKPPLPTWIAAGVELLFPENLVVQRYMAAISATIMVFFLYFLVSRLTKNRNIGLLSSLVLASCFNIILMGRTATWDIYCHSFMLGAIYFLVLGLEEKGKQWGHFFITGLFLGLSFLSKGPVSFYALLLPFLISYIIVLRPSAKGKMLPILIMILTCLVISTWWPVYARLSHPELAVAVADKESSSWLNHNVRPLYYYWQFPAEAGIWALFWITSLCWFHWKKKIENRHVYILSVIWTLAAFILLSLIPEKKTRYLLPMLIPGAINIGFYIYHCANSIMTSKEKNTFRFNIIVIILILVALPVALYIMFFKDGLVTLPLYIVTSIISICLAVFLIISVFNKHRINVLKAFTGILLTMIMVEGLCMIPAGNMFINNDRHSIRMLRKIDRVQNMPFFYNEKEQLRMELVYEANQVIRPLNVSDSALIQSKLPFVFVSGAPIDSLLTGKNVKIEYIDTFDNNWQKSSSRRYNEDLVRQVAIISKLK